MSTITLSILLSEINRKIIFKSPRDITAFDLCRDIQSSIKDSGKGPEFGIFISDNDPKQSYWLESSRLLSYYHLYDKMEVEYRSKLRRVIISTMDGTRKTIQVDDNKTIADLMLTICSKMGLTNHEEYSLINEKNRGQTLRRPKNAARDYEKFEKMKQKLQTDDDANWLSHSKTLRQHGIEETDVLLLRRKYFFSDQNVGARDPLQLNLLFLQLKEAILNGAHPISIEQAVELAGLQCQAEMGNMVSEKIKSTCIDIKEHLPKEYVKVKNVEKRIKETYQKLNGLMEKDAKMRYIQLCRSIPTYGITFFLIKEKLSGRNKLVPRLFGVSKESVMRVDEKTKDIIQTWPLTQIRRWAATANLFTLDFGEYSPEGNYVIQTMEGEQIAQLISGYIDIILRRKKKPDDMENESNDSNAIVEENVEPSRAEIISNVGTMGRGYGVSGRQVAMDGYVGQAGTFTRGHTGVAGEAVSDQYFGGSGVAMRAQVVGGKRRGDESGNGFQMKELSQPKRAVLTRIDTNANEIKHASDSLQQPYFEDNDTVTRDDLATQRWRTENMTQARAGISSHLGAMTVATGNLLSVLQPPTDARFDDDESQSPIDYTAVDASLATIGINVQGLMQNVRVLDQLQAADAGFEEVSKGEEGQPRSQPQQGSDSQSDITSAARDVAAAFLYLMETAMPPKECATSEDPMESKDRLNLYEAASRVGDASQQLLQLVSANQLQMHRRRRVDRLETILEDEDEGDEYPDYDVDSNALIDNNHALAWQMRDELLAATKEVASSTANLVKFAKAAAVAINQEAMELTNTETNSVELADQRDHRVAFLRNAQSDMIHAAKHAGKATSRLVTCAKVVVCAMEQPASQRQLLDCVKQVGLAVDELVEIAGSVVDTPYLPLQSMEQRAGQTQTFNGLREATGDVNVSLERLINRLMAASIQAQQDPVVASLLEVSQQVPASLGDGEALLMQSENLVNIAEALINELRTNRELLGAAKVSESEAALRADLLTKAASELVDVMKALASGNQQSLPHQQEVVAASNRLVQKAHALAAPIIRSRLTSGLEVATRLTANNVNQLTTVTEEAVRCSRTSQYRLLKELDQLQGEVMPQVNLSCDNARARPQDLPNQTNLLAASKNLMDVLKDFLNSVDILAPTIPDAGIQAALTSAFKDTQICLTDLRQCCASAESILKVAPLFLPADLEALTNQRASQAATPTSSLVHKVWPAISSRLAKMQTALNSNSDHSLPGDTLDSVCGNLMNAIAKFNDAFASPLSNENGASSTCSALPDCLSEEAKAISEGSMASVGPNSLPPVTAKLLSNLDSVVAGVRGLAGYLSTVSEASNVDNTEIADVLIASWNLLPVPKDKHSRRLSRDTSQDFTAQLAAHELKNGVLENGLECLGIAHESLLWASHEDELSSAQQRIGENATKLVACINDLKKYVPGNQIVSKLNSFVDQMVKIEQRPSQTQPINEQANDTAPSMDPDVLLKALRGLADACEDTSRLASDQSNKRRDDGDASSSTCSLSMAADRLANALFQVLDAFHADGHQQPINDPLLDDLQQVAKPLAVELQKAMACEVQGTPTASQHAVYISKASLVLRDWALNAGKQKQDQMAKQRLIGAPSKDETPITAAEKQLKAVQSQLASALEQTRSPAVTNGNVGKVVYPETGDEFPLISYSVSKLTFPECSTEIDNLTQVMSEAMDLIPASVRNRNTNAFCTAVQGVADAALGMLRTATQSAYLVAASHPANEAGRAPRLTPLEAHQLVASRDAIYTDLDTVVRDAPSAFTSSDPTRFQEISETVSRITLISSRMCQQARQCIAESSQAAEKKTLAEYAKDVAQITTHLVNTVHNEQLNQATGEQVSHLANALMGSVDRLSSALLKDIGDMPIQVMPESGSLQAPMLYRGRQIIIKAKNLTECANHLLQDSCKPETETAYSQCRKEVTLAANDLQLCLGQNRPGTEAIQNLQRISRELLRELDQAGLSYQGKKSSLEANGTLINSSLHQIASLSGKLAGDWRQTRWELLSHDAHQIGSYLHSLVNECIPASAGLTRSSDQASLQAHLRTVLESTEVLSTRLLTGVNHCFGGPPDNDPSPIASNSEQLRVACRDLLACVNEISSRQGTVDSQIAVIHSACAKLESDSSPPCSPETQRLVPLQARLANQAKHVAQAAGSLSEASKVGAQDSEQSSAITMGKEFSRAVETAQLLSGFLSRQPQRTWPISQEGQAGEFESGAHLAERLRLAVQRLGVSCVELLQHPKHPDSLRTLMTRVTNLVAVLRESAHGVHACVNAAEAISNVVAEFDSAIYFARADSLVDNMSQLSVDNLSTSSTGSSNEVQLAQEEIMHLSKGIMEETNALCQNATGEQDNLAVSSQNCLIHVKQLHSTTLRLVSSSHLSMHQSQPEAQTEARVSLLTAARAVSTSLIDLLSQSRAFASADFSGDGRPVSQGDPDKTQLNHTAKEVVTRVSELRVSLRHFIEICLPPKSPSPTIIGATTPSPAVGMTFPKLRHAGSQKPSAGTVGVNHDDSATGSVRAGLQSALSSIHSLSSRLEGWTPASGTFRDEDDMEYERELASDSKTTPEQIRQAALGITQSALKANSATMGTGRKLTEISLAGELIHQSATELVRRLRCGSRVVVVTTQQRRQSDAGNGVSGNDEPGKACTRAIEGGKATLDELAIMLENMIKSLDDPGSGQPPSMQVTLAMRRLRETVFEICEGAKQMPGGSNDSDSPPTEVSFRCSFAPPTPPRPVIPARPVPSSFTQSQQKPGVVSSNILFTPSQLAQSIAQAEGIAMEVNDVAGTSELRSFTNEIEISMRKLVQLQSRVSQNAGHASASGGSSGLHSNVEEDAGEDGEGLDAILIACRRLAHATANLMHWAAAAQRELVQQGRLKAVSQEPLENEAESQWTCGLISAARYVAATTSLLVESAQILVAMRSGSLCGGDLGTSNANSLRFAPEGLVAAARTAISNTGQLVFACMAKSEESSLSMRGLNSAASVLKRHAERLVVLAQSVALPTNPSTSDGDQEVDELDENGQPSGPKRTTFETMREVIETKSSIAHKMAELENLQKRLKSINKETCRQRSDGTEF